VNVVARSLTKFSLAEGEGPTKGKYRVEFSVPSATKRRVPNDDIPDSSSKRRPKPFAPLSSRFDDGSRLRSGESTALRRRVTTR